VIQYIGISHADRPGFELYNLEGDLGILAFNTARCLLQLL
jgi:hypothetical protein